MPSQEPSAGPPDRAATRGAPEPGGDTAAPPLGLLRMTRRIGLPAGGRELYRHMARLLEIEPEHEFVLVPGGRGVAHQYVAEFTGASGAGADPEADLVEAATARARDLGLATRLHFETAPLDDLPYKDAVFDVAIGDLGLATAADPVGAVRELVRVTRPMGSIVLVQLTWIGSVERARQEALVDHLGVRPFMLVEWKQMLREAGVVDLYVEDWSEAAGVLRQSLIFGSLLPLRHRISLVFRAWQRWGARGVWQAVRRERELRRMLTHERVIGVSLIKGTKWQPNGGEETEPAG